MTVLALVAALVLLAALAALQMLVAFGLPLGHFVWGGQHRILPARLRVGSVISVAIYIGVAILLLSRGGVIPGDSTFVRVAVWVLFAFFILSTIMNGISRSRPERFTMTPISIALATATLIIALEG